MFIDSGFDYEIKSCSHPFLTDSELNYLFYVEESCLFVELITQRPATQSVSECAIRL